MNKQEVLAKIKKNSQLDRAAKKEKLPRMTYKGCQIKINTVKDGADKGKFVWENTTSGDESAEVFNNSADAWEDAKQFVDENLDDGSHDDD